MNIKQPLCIMLATAICCVGIFAQNTRSALELLSLDFAERLIRDGGREAKISALTQNLSEADRAHLDEYRELNALMAKPSKIKKNHELIAQKATAFAATEKEDLYISHEVKNSTWALNMLPGFGLGSFRQGDIGGGLVQLAMTGVGGMLILIGANSEETDEYDTHMTPGGVARIAMGASLVVVANVIVGTIRPAYFKSTRNAYLRTSLGLDKNGKSVAQSERESNVQFGIAPLVNPVANQYGAVAMIRF